jgi:heat shock protein HtpX
VANRDAAVLTALSVPRVTARRTMERFGANPVVALLALTVLAMARFWVAVVSRAREYAADDGAVAVTGDPAALASALETLDAELGRRPASDLRQSAPSAFAIVPPPWEEHRFFDRTRRLVARRLLGTHPPTERRIERLRAVETENASA